jgi:hypothetical protein
VRIKLIVLGFLFSIIGAALPQVSLIGAAQAAQDEFTAQDLAAPPDATIDFDAKQMRLIFGGAKGKGVLHFKDTDYPFTMKAVTVGGVGYTEVHGTGTVHRLTKVGDFAGTYSGVGIGAALAKGKGASSFQNNKGVVVTTRSKADGAALNLGASAVTITLGK